MPPVGRPERAKQRRRLRVVDHVAHVQRAGSGVRSERAARPPLVGFRLYSVQFVMDYMQLRFDGPLPDMPVLNCDVMPTVEVGAETLVDGQIGYADASRRLIPSVVRRTQEGTGIGLRVEFDTGAIVVHPAREDLTGPEIALLGGFADRRWMCWRPGEESFEDLT
jgi:hypothetical protein